MAGLCWQSGGGVAACVSYAVIATVVVAGSVGRVGEFRLSWALRGNPLLGRNLQLAKYTRVSGAILSLPGSPPVSLRIRRAVRRSALGLAAPVLRINSQ